MGIALVTRYRVRVKQADFLHACRFDFQRVLYYCFNVVGEKIGEKRFSALKTLYWHGANDNPS
jgi:hypothetical protein